jgi:hypothetical protein
LFGHRIVALTAEVGGVDGGAGKMGGKVFSQVLHVLRGSRDSVKANYDKLSFPGRHPFPVGQAMGVEGGVFIVPESRDGGGRRHGRR